MLVDKNIHMYEMRKANYGSHLAKIIFWLKMSIIYAYKF